MSEHKSLAEALVAFQADAPTLGKDALNPHYRSKYTPLNTIVEAVRPILAKHGLAWSALPCVADGKPALRYQLLHGPSGETLGDTMPLLLPKQDVQGLGSALTYSKRQLLEAVLNLAGSEDDDGEAASPKEQKRAEANSGPELVSADDIASLRGAAKGLTTGQVRLALGAVGVPSEEGEDLPLVRVPKNKAALLAEKLAKAER